MMVYLTPFRRPSADVGSAYEMGFMRPIGPSISAYPNDPLPSAGRTASAPNGGVRRFRRCGFGPFARHSNLLLGGAITDECLFTAGLPATCQKLCFAQR
jgi:hypothetical protein